MKYQAPTATQLPQWRQYFIWVMLALGLIVLLWRTIDLQILKRDFLVLQGDARQQRTIEISAHRGMILDRNNQALAVSTPVDSIWVNPVEILQSNKAIVALAQVLALNVNSLHKKIEQNDQREFLYVKRHLSPDESKPILALNLPGVYSQREYRRYYPTGEVGAHLLGFTDIDDKGQEGVELAFNDWLSGESGLKRVVRDRLGHVVENIESIRSAQAGRDLKLSIDKRLQYLAYRELKSIVQKHNAVSGSAVMLDAQTGEVLAIVNQPALNPNSRKDLQSQLYRNRAITDVFEPGSTMKPFTVAVALESGLYTPHTAVDTNPGFIQLAQYKIKDIKNYGRIDVSDVILKSSTVGAILIAQTLPPEQFWSIYDQMGFGHSTGSGFPGEATGTLNHHSQWSSIEKSTIAYGYGIATTTLQLAHAYSVIANDGLSFPVTLQVRDQPIEGQRVLSPTTAKELRRMMMKVVSSDGTGKNAKVPGYTIAGKTGTAHKTVAGGYADHRYLAVFAGMAPAKQSRLVLVVAINEPQGGYFGGEVAAPAFANIMSGALRMLNIPPDDLPVLHARYVIPADERT